MNDRHFPPNWILRFFRWFCHPDYREDIEGDLMERFRKRAGEKNLTEAKRQFAWEIIKLFRPGIIRYANIRRLGHFGLFNNYIKISYRHLLRDKPYFFTNLAGLSCGITCFILIYIFVYNELSYDDFHLNKDRIYRVVRNQNNSLFGPPFGHSLLKENFPELENVTRFTRANGSELSHEKKRFTDLNLYFADPSAMKSFSFEVISSDRTTPLNEANSLVLTEKAAKKFFGEQYPVGKVMLYQNEHLLKVSAVVKDVSVKTHLPFDALIHHQLQDQLWGKEILADRNAWFWATTTCYLTLRENVQLGNLRKKLDEFCARHVDDNKKHLTHLSLQSLDDIYLHSNGISGFHSLGDIRYVYIFSGLAILILIIAAVNFINLATARSVQRVREVGIRKSLGERRFQLSTQFLVEAYLIVGSSLIISVLLVKILFPYYVNLVGKVLVFDISSHAATLVVLTLVVGFLSGGYPSFILSSFHPVKALKGEVKYQRTGIGVRKALVTSQFLIGMVVVMVAIVIYQQMTYISNKELGFRKDQILVIDFPHISPEKYNLLKHELLVHSNIESIGGSWIPAFHSVGAMGPVKAEIDDELTEIIPNPHFLWVDEDFAETYELTFIEGTDFTRGYSRHGLEFILNESAVKQIGYATPENALDKKFQYTSQRQGVITGIVKDFHFESLRIKIKPLVLFQEPERINVMGIKLNTADISGTLDFIQSKLTEHFPDQLFPISFLDQQFQALYDNVKRMQYLFIIFGVLGAFMQGIGLFTLVSYSLAYQRKEIGIRKVMGASTTHIVSRFNLQYGLPVLVAFISACPLAFLFTSRWLEEFAYHTDVTYVPFLIAGLLAFFIAFGTISMQVFKAAGINPVNSLRHE